MNHKLKILAAACTASFLAHSAFAGGDKVSLSAWDANDNGMVSLQEWDDAMEEHEVFDKIDENSNGIFDIEEADEEFLEYDVKMDLDDGGHIERQEFTQGTFDRLDTNDDDNLDANEFAKFSAKASESRLLTSN